MAERASAEPPVDRVLGAILAGGRSARFGSDKAAALLDGVPLLDRVAAALRPQVAALVVCGRDRPGIVSLGDRPAPDLGPLGGLCAALAFAAAEGFDWVLSAGCDVLPVPGDLLARLAPGPAHVEGQPLLGLWPADIASRLDSHLRSSEDRSMRGWARAAGARAVPLAERLYNLNRREDLDRFESTRFRAGPTRE